jgi:hypothetical protein
MPAPPGIFGGGTVEMHLTCQKNPLKTLPAGTTISGMSPGCATESWVHSLTCGKMKL